jgi:hypothetical protein
MRREVAIYIETDIAQAETNYSRLELFNDEKISVSSTIQNISDISKIFTDFSQGFTIPCSPTNNAIFKHFYQNDVDTLGIIDYQNRYNAYIEIDTVFFRRGKIQLEKANLKDGKADSYSVTFYGAGVSLKDYFNEDKLSQLDYTTLDHDYTNQEVYDRVTIDSLVTDYNVRYPLITSKRVWQFGSSFPLPTESCPTWFEYPVNDTLNIGTYAGRIFYNELFPAVRVANIFDLIESQYQITFNGLFLSSDMFKKAFLLYKNKAENTIQSNAVDLDFTSTSGVLGSAFNTTTNSFLRIESAAGANVQHELQWIVTALSPPYSQFYIDVYKNGVFQHTDSGQDVTSFGQYYSIPINQGEIVTFQIRSLVAITIDISLQYLKITTSPGGSSSIVSGVALSTATTVMFTDLKKLAPDMKIADFITGICKEFNMTVYSNTKNVFTFDPLPVWYGRGVIRDITQYTDVTSIEIERMKLYKSIEFKYQDSECFLNKYFLQSQSNPDAHGYGNAKQGFNYDGGEYKIESPFENLLHNNFQNNLQVGYALNKEFSPYIPKPCLLYMNQLTTLTAGDKINWDGLAATDVYVPFGQDSNILFDTGLIPLTLNFSAEISSFYNEVNLNTIYNIYYSSYINNLYNIKNRLVKVKTILPISILTTLQLNDRLVIRDKRYLINEMQSDLTTGDVNFTLISDFAEVKPIKYADSSVSTGSEHKSAIYFSNGVTQVAVTKSANASNVTLSSAKFSSEGFLTITVPPNAARTITITLSSDYINGYKEDAYIIIEQQ